MKSLFLDRIHSPIGDLLLVSDQAIVYALDFEDFQPRMMHLLEKRFPSLQLTQTNPTGELRDRLLAYLEGDLSGFNDVAVHPGGTPFQQQVWQALRSIPVGTAWTYKQLAEHIGHPQACRAVGMANSQNPIAIIVPCHRVIGRQNRLTGYAGGLDRKQWLLHHEGVLLSQAS